MAWLPNGEKISKICLFILTECTNMTDRQTPTPHNDIGCASIASRGKKHSQLMSAAGLSLQIAYSGINIEHLSCGY